MKKSSALTAMAAAMFMAGTHEFSRKDAPVLEKPSIERQAVPPKGTKEYFFNEDGEFSTESMKKSECIFTCFAVNDRNALRKFYNWNNGNNSVCSNVV